MKSLVNLLKEKGIIRTPRVETTMAKVDRANYCKTSNPYADSPCGIGYGVTISAPHMHAHALEAVSDHLVDGSRALDVGSGSGYLTSCLAHMVGDKGYVVGVEHVKELVHQSEINIRRDCPELLDSGRIRLIVADGRNGAPEFGPYDVIHVGATAPELPKQLVGQLKEGGVMVIPVQRDDHQSFDKIEKLRGGELITTALLKVVYVPLTDLDSQLDREGQ